MRLLSTAACLFGCLLACSEARAAEGDASTPPSSPVSGQAAVEAAPPVPPAGPPWDPWKGSPSTPSVEEAPRTTWVANQPMLFLGAGLTGIGYLPNVAAGLPSTAGFVGRVVALFFTLGIPCIVGQLKGGSSGYLCEGGHGAMQLLIPFAGPITFANSHPRDSVLNPHGSPLTGTTKGLLYTSSALQIAGVSSMLLSLAFGRSVPVRRPSAAAGPSFTLAPLEAPDVAGATVGLSLGVQRW